MSFALMRGFRPLSRIAQPSLLNSYLITGSAMKPLAPIASSTALQPANSTQLQHRVAGMSSLSGTTHWKVERIVATAMLGIIPGAFIFESPLMNYLFAASVALHAHWGMETVLIDYCPRPFLPLANLIRALMTAICFGGLSYFAYNDIGLIAALKKLWALH